MFHNDAKNFSFCTVSKCLCSVLESAGVGSAESKHRESVLFLSLFCWKLFEGLTQMRFLLESDSPGGEKNSLGEGVPAVL